MFLQLQLIPIDMHVPSSMSLSSDGNLLKVLFIILILNVCFQLLHVSMHLYKNFKKKSLKNAPEFLETGGDGQNNNKEPGKDKNKSFYEKYKTYIWISITLTSLSLFIYYYYNVDGFSSLFNVTSNNATICANNINEIKNTISDLDKNIIYIVKVLGEDNLTFEEFKTLKQLRTILEKMLNIYHLSLDYVKNHNIIQQEKQLVISILDCVDIDVTKSNYKLFTDIRKICST